jgi:phosphoribosyl-ATP pyrophosphohydrolase/phosphoribosyl-AMP cyclohydrolase
MKSSVESLKFDENGLIPAVVQDAATGEILTLAYMNAESLSRTLTERETWFWSRSRQELWHKGATSGHTQHVLEVKSDCDDDALVVKVIPSGPACHTGATSCFHHALDGFDSEEGSNEAFPLGTVLDRLFKVILDRRKERPEGSYTTYLFEKGLDKILKKVGEEAAETIIAAKNEDKKQLIAETSDLLYHLLVLMVERDVNLEEIAAELRGREGQRTEK